MVNPPMVKGYNINHILKLHHSQKGASVFRSHTAFPRSRKHGPKQYSHSGHRMLLLRASAEKDGRNDHDKQKIPISRINFLFSEKKCNFADGQLAQTGWRVDLHYGKGRLLT